MRSMFINGEFTTGAAKGEIKVYNPATEEVLDTVPQGTVEGVGAAVTSARAAFDDWRKLGANERTALLHQVADNIYAPISMKLSNC